MDELVAAISREDFEDQSSEYIKELQKSFKRDAKCFNVQDGCTVELGQRSFVVNHLYYRSGTRQRAEVQEAKGQ